MQSSCESTILPNICFEHRDEIPIILHVALWLRCQRQHTCPSLCSPSGWDNEKKIGILHENFSTVRPEDPFEDFIVKPPVRKVRRGERVEETHTHTQDTLHLHLCGEAEEMAPL